MPEITSTLIADLPQASAASELTPAFKRMQITEAEVFAAQAKATEPQSKIIFIVGGLSGSGKTTHLQEFIKRLNSIGTSFEYIDKDAVGQEMQRMQGMEAVITSPQIYAEMIKRAENALKTKTVILLEGNMIGNLGCLTDFIVDQDANNVIVTCLDFICSDAKKQFDRITARAIDDKEAAKRDKDKLQSFEYYRDKDRPKEIGRHDDQLAKHQDLIDNGVLILKEIDTLTLTVSENVDAIMQFMQEAIASSHTSAHISASANRRSFAALPGFMN